jgi:hypothetical protein
MYLSTLIPEPSQYGSEMSIGTIEKNRHTVRSTYKKSEGPGVCKLCITNPVKSIIDDDIPNYESLYIYLFLKSFF